MFSDAKIKIKNDKPNTTIAFFSVKDYVMHKTLFKGCVRECEMLKNELFTQKTCIYHFFNLHLQHLYLRFRNYRNHLFGLVRPASTPFLCLLQGFFMLLEALTD